MTSEQSQRPWMVQAWIDGEMSTSEAVFEALLSEDLVARIWADVVATLAIRHPDNALIAEVVA